MAEGLVEQLIRLYRENADRSEIQAFMRNNSKGFIDLPNPARIGEAFILLESEGLNVEGFKEDFEKLVAKKELDTDRDQLAWTTAAALVVTGASVGLAASAIPAVGGVTGLGSSALRGLGRFIFGANKPGSRLGGRPVRKTFGGLLATTAVSGTVGLTDVSNIGGFGEGEPGVDRGLGQQFQQGGQDLRREEFSQEALDRIEAEEQGFAEIRGQFPENLPTGFNILLVDHSGDITGTPGAVVVVSPKDLGLPFEGGDAQQGFQASRNQPSLGGTAEVIFQDVFSRSVEALGADDFNVLQAIFPQGIGDLTIKAPFQITPGKLRGTARPGQVRDEEFSSAAQVRQDEANFNQPIPETVKGLAGAELAPKSFNVFNGKTLLEWTSIAAQSNGVPVNLLYALISHESGYNPNATGQVGERGLAQINPPSFPNVSGSQAYHPVFALNFAAQKMRQRFNTYGSWMIAVAAHNSPVAAEFLSRTGKFKTAQSASYTQAILGKANRSGLSDQLYDDGSFGSGPETASVGPTFAPFRTPDPAQSREFVEATYQELLGRSPNEDEFVAGVKRIAALARQSYSSELRIAQGSESQAVDVGAQFTQEVKGTGEFAFHETVGQTNKFTDYAASIARLLQQGV